MTVLLKFNEVEALLVAYLAQVFSALRVEPLPFELETYSLGAAERAAVLVLLRRMKHPAPPQIYFAEGFGQVLTGDQPYMESTLVVSVRDNAKRKIVSDYLMNLRLSMAGFTLPVPAGIPGAWICTVVEEVFLSEADGVWTYGATYGIFFRPHPPAIDIQPVFHPASAPERKEGGA